MSKQKKERDNSWIPDVVAALIVALAFVLLIFGLAEVGGSSNDSLYRSWEQDWQEYERLTGNERPIDWHYEEVK